MLGVGACAGAPFGPVPGHVDGAWQHASGGFHVRGQACIDLPDDVTAMIAKARETGFGTEGREFDLLTDPVSGFVVFSFNG